jgi:hypothetical protein
VFFLNQAEKRFKNLLNLFGRNPLTIAVDYDPYEFYVAVSASRYRSTFEFANLIALESRY